MTTDIRDCPPGTVPHRHCPKCKREMYLGRGTHGTFWWVCSNSGNCDGFLPSDAHVREDEAEWRAAKAGML